MQGSHRDTHIGEAWGKLREGQSDGAIAGFEKVLQSAPNNVDAYYGLGLALRAKGQEADAIEAFQKAKEHAATLLEAIRSQVGAENSLETTEDDRYMMLSRMIRQRLVELGVNP